MAGIEAGRLIIEDVRKTLSRALDKGVDAALSVYSETCNESPPSQVPSASKVTIAILEGVEQSLSVVFKVFLAELKRKRNAMAALAKLSDELLSRIFLFAAQDASNVHEKITLTHVCSRWREIMVNDSRLWTNIDFADTQVVVDECLRRAGQAPLHLRQQWSYDSGDFAGEIVEVFEERHKQVRSLSVTMPVDQVEFATRLVARSIPMARIFNVAVVHGGWGEEQSAVGPRIENLFEGEAPQLQYLCLQRLGLPWTLTQIPTLTTLMLEKCYFTGPTSSLDFITVLESLPLLKQLSLVDCHGLCHAPSVHTRLVSLPDLHVARLEALKPSDLVHILSSISASPSLRLTCHCRFSEGDSVTQFSDIRLSHLESLHTVQDLCVDVTHVDMRAIESVTLTGSRVKSGVNKNMLFTLSGTGPQWIERCFPAVCEPFDFSGVKRLSFTWRGGGWSGIFTDNLPIHDSSADLAFFLRRCPDLVSLTLFGWSKANVLDVLVEETAPRSALCTMLRSVQLENTSVTDERLKALVLKRQGCKRLQSLTLKGCYGFSSETINWLRDMIEDVFCDSEANEVAFFEEAP